MAEVLIFKRQLENVFPNVRFASQGHPELLAVVRRRASAYKIIYNLAVAHAAELYALVLDEFFHVLFGGSGDIDRLRNGKMLRQDDRDGWMPPIRNLLRQVSFGFLGGDQSFLVQVNQMLPQDTHSAAGGRLCHEKPQRPGAGVDGQHASGRRLGAREKKM